MCLMWLITNPTYPLGRKMLSRSIKKVIYKFPDSYYNGIYAMKVRTMNSMDHSCL